MKKKKKYHTIIYYLTVLFLVIFFTITSTALILMQTIWGREKIKVAFITYAKKNNINLKIESIKGLIPFEYKMQNIKIILENSEFDIKNLDCRINIVSLLKNKLSFKTFEATDISFELKKTFEPSKNEVFWITFPISVNFEKLKLNNLYFKINETPISFNIQGKGKIEKYGNLITSDLVIKRKNYDNSYIDLSFKGTKENRLIDITAYSNIENLKVLQPFIKKDDFDICFDMNLKTKGNLDSYLGYLQKNQKKYSKIQGNVYGNIFDIKIKNKSFNFLTKDSKFSFDFSTFDDLSFNISKAFLKNNLFNIYVDALITKNFMIDKSSLIFKIDDFSKFQTNLTSLYGSFYMQTNYDKKLLNSNFTFQNFKINNISFVDFKGNIKGKIDQNILSGNIISSSYCLNQIFNLSSNYKLEKSFLNLTNLKINSPSSKLSANLILTPNFTVLGSGKIHFEDLKQIPFPIIIFKGLADIDFDFKQKMQKKPIQTLLITIVLNDYHFDNFIGKNLNIYIDIDNPFSKPSTNFDINFNNLKFHELNFDSLNITSSTKEENWPYIAKATGNLKQPFSIESKGFWNMKKNNFILNIQDLNGHFFNYNFITPKPIKLEISENIFLLSDFFLQLADSSIFADINFTKKTSRAQINLKHFPLDFLSINPLDLDISGLVTLDLNLEGHNNDINSTLDVDLEELNILSLGDKAPLQSYGKLKSEIKNNYFNLEGFLNVKETQLFSFKGKIPLNIDLIKLNFKPDIQKSIFLDIKYNGKIEEILDFIDVGPQRLEGNLSSQITLSNKIENLNLDGFCLFKNGFYENYYTGTILKDIEANFKATNEKIILEYLKGKDTENGNLYAEGLFSTSQKKHFPFYLKTEIKDFLCIDSEIFKTVATANIEISGDSLSSLAKGNVSIDKLEMTIPDKLPIVIPDLKPLFIYHPYQKDVKEKKIKPTFYPTHLNFDIEANKNPISINGQGLTSKWQGFFKIGGTYMNLETKGSLDLIKGKFVFSGRQFDLTKGKVLFSGISNELPTLDIQAKMTQQGVNILANVQGPLDSPKIFFTSSPPLPASSIMSLLIFGQQLSDLSAAQTVELSSFMTTQLDQLFLSKSDSIANLGIDRFNIVQPSPTDPFATDQMALQFGKYISKGIVISFSQGEEQGSSNVIVEVDLKHGFIFQAESQQQEEQGKFSLKYRYNY